MLTYKLGLMTGTRMHPKEIEYPHYQRIPVLLHQVLRPDLFTFTISLLKSYQFAKFSGDPQVVLGFSWFKPRSSLPGYIFQFTAATEVMPGQIVRVPQLLSIRESPRVLEQYAQWMGIDLPGWVPDIQALSSPVNPKVEVVQ